LATKRRMSHGHAMRSIFGRSRVIHLPGMFFSVVVLVRDIHEPKYDTSVS
jgi:hypothetical protein